MSQTVTLAFAPTAAPNARALLHDNGFEIEDAPHAFWRARGDGAVATFYKSGKLVVQGKMAEHWAQFLDPQMLLPGDSGESAAPGDAFAAALAKHPDPPPERWVGIDESGKGDYFGPLVVCAALVEREQIGWLREIGVADSKQLSDAQARRLSGMLRKTISHELVLIGPRKYNQLYEKIGNLNRLLAWGHGRALESLLDKRAEAGEAACDYALGDQFAKDPRLVERALGPLGQALRFEQRTKAEADPGVAVASIIARAVFLDRLDSLSRQVGVPLHKGAGAPVLTAGRKLVATAGPDALDDVAKLHFATTKKLR